MEETNIMPADKRDLFKDSYEKVTLRGSTTC